MQFWWFCTRNSVAFVSLFLISKKGVSHKAANSPNDSVSDVTQQVISELNGKDINEVMNAGKAALHLLLDLHNMKISWAGFLHKSHFVFYFATGLSKLASVPAGGAVAVSAAAAGGGGAAPAGEAPAGG